MIKIVDTVQARELVEGSLFFMKRGNHVFGLFKKSKGRFGLASKNIVSLDLSILPDRLNEDLIISALMFKQRRESKKAFLKIREVDNSLKFFFVLFDGRGVVEVEESVVFSSKLKEEILSLRSSNPYFLSSKEVLSLIKVLIPKSILKYFKRIGVLFTDIESGLDFLPLEVLCNEFDIVINRVLPSDFSVSSTLSTLGIFYCSWNKNLEFTFVESVEIFEDAKNYFSKVDLLSHKMNLSQLLSFMNRDVVYLSSHADSDGIDLGDVKLNFSVANFIDNVPKVLILNNCYFDGILDLIKVLISKGTSCVISPFSKIPDSNFTKFFIKNFFHVFSRSLDVNLSMYVSSKTSKSKGLYNHLLYRVYVYSKR